MRKSLLVIAMLTAAALLAAGCVDDNTGDVGNKNIRPNYADDYEKNGLSMNGTYSGDDNLTYRTRLLANDLLKRQDRFNGRNGIGNGMTRVQSNGNNAGNMTQSTFEVNERIAGQIAALPEVGDAYVAILGQNAYVAISDERHAISPYAANVGTELRNKISSKVKALAPSVQNVYVSTHPEAIEQLQSYTAASKTGQPPQQFLAEFNSITAKRFSDARIIR